MTLSRASIEAGRTVDVTYRFAVASDAAPFAEDFTVFVHAVDDNGNRPWADDHAPPTPTRAWKAGGTIEYTRPMLVPRSSPAGPLHLDIGLYSPGSGDRLALDATDEGRRAYRVASLTVLPAASVAGAIFVDGWYDVEVAGDAAGTEWRWSQTEGEIWFRNPRRDSVLVIQLDASIPGLTGPRRVEIRTGNGVMDRFTVTPGMTEVRRVSVPAAHLGNGDIARMTLAVDDALAPAQMPGSVSADTRTLGVRVFEAHLEWE